jgi:hypothetical protein
LGFGGEKNPFISRKGDSTGNLRHMRDKTKRKTKREKMLQKKEEKIKIKGNCNKKQVY